jgi:signal peptidase II
MDQLEKAIAVFLLGYPGESQSFVSFLGDYFTRIQEFPWRIGSDGYKPAVEVIDGFLRWQLTTNTGAAFSIFSNHPGKLALVSAILIIFLYVLFLKYGRGSNIWPIAFGLQIGGAFGNFVDRARLREVVDFVAVKIPSVIDGRLVWVDFPIFNVADACAVVGTVSIGLMFVTLDIAHSQAVRKARFEIEWMGLRAARDISIVHALDHNRYTAVVLRIEQPPVRVESEAPSDGEEIDETTVADNRVESMPSEDANVIAIIVETKTAHNEIGYDE